ncbi:MAG TPA: UbiA family prenyltransferase [Nitrososphaerales archaeon]|nr:UbiA family prenyltransferase [Nitrososphaerales archaeon]
MSLATRAYKELVYGGHLLALGTSSMAATVAIVLGRVPSWDLLLMAYLFSLGAYSINRMSDFEQDTVSHPDRTAYLRGRRGALKGIAAGCFSLGYVLALLRSLIFFSALLVPLVLAVAYSVSSGKMRSALGVSRLKEITLVKNVTISFGWSLVPVLVGLYYLDLPAAVLGLAPFIFLRLMVNTIFFDQRDLDADAKFGVKTLPVKLGLAGSSRVMDVLDLASGAYIVGLVAVGIAPFFALALLIFVPYSFAYRAYAKSGRHRDSLRDLAADGEYLLWGVVTYIGHL